MKPFQETARLKRHALAGLMAFVFFTIVGHPNAEADHRRASGIFEPAHFVLVHGAWHGAWSWYKTKTQLEAVGHTVTAVELPSHGIDKALPETVMLDDYVNRVAEAIDAAEEPVILVGHSLGGIVISMAAEARPGGVDKLVYLAALLLEDGLSVFDIMTLAPDAPIVEHMIPGDGTMDINRDAAAFLFYNKTPKADITLAESLITVDPLYPLATPISITDENFGSVPRYYIETTDDNTIPPDMQVYMYTTLPCDDVYTIDSDHSPFFSRPFRLTMILLQIAYR